MNSPGDTNRPPSAARDGQDVPARDGHDVLANLPRTRPQRSTPRRAAARRAAGAEQAANAAPSANGAGPAEGARPAKGTTAGGAKRAPRAARADAATSPRKPRAAKGAAGASGAPAATRPRRAPAKASTGTDSVPRQGFASDGDRVSGPVAPPGGAEFLATAAEIVNELAKAGFSSGERLFKDILSRLPLS